MAIGTRCHERTTSDAHGFLPVLWPDVKLKRRRKAQVLGLVVGSVKYEGISEEGLVQDSGRRVCPR